MVEEAQQNVNAIRRVNRPKRRSEAEAKQGEATVRDLQRSIQVEAQDIGIDLGLEKKKEGIQGQYKKEEREENDREVIDANGKAHIKVDDKKEVPINKKIEPVIGRKKLSVSVNRNQGTRDILDSDEDSEDIHKNERNKDKFDSNTRNKPLKIKLNMSNFNNTLDSRKMEIKDKLLTKNISGIGFGPSNITKGESDSTKIKEEGLIMKTSSFMKEPATPVKTSQINDNNINHGRVPLNPTPLSGRRDSARNFKSSMSQRKQMIVKTEQLLNSQNGQQEVDKQKKKIK